MFSHYAKRASGVQPECDTRALTPAAPCYTAINDTWRSGEQALNLRGGRRHIGASWGERSQLSRLEMEKIKKAVPSSIGGGNILEIAGILLG